MAEGEDPTATIERAKTKNEVPKDGSVEANAAAVVPEATPKPSIASVEPTVESRAARLECLQTTCLQTTESIESALETFEAAARSNAADSKKVPVRVRSRVSAAVRAFAVRAARYVCLALLYFFFLAAVSAAFRRARADGSVILETCPAPSPITAARTNEKTKTNGPFRLEPNVILPRDSFPATETWTF